MSIVGKLILAGLGMLFLLAVVYCFAWDYWLKKHPEVKVRTL